MIHLIKLFIDDGTYILDELRNDIFVIDGFKYRLKLFCYREKVYVSLHLMSLSSEIWGITVFGDVFILELQKQLQLDQFRLEKMNYAVSLNVSKIYLNYHLN